MRPETIVSDQDSTDVDDQIVRYYDVCWTERIRHGHNPMSLAIHFGFYPTGRESAEEAELEVNRLLARQLGIEDAPFALLDGGCGVGGAPIDLARRFARLTAIGVNLSAGQVAMAREFAARAGVADRVVFRQANYLATGLAGGCVDGIACIESLCHRRRRGMFLAEAWRLLRRRGRLCVIDFFRTGRLLRGAELRAYREVVGAFVLADYYDVPLDEPARRAGFSTLRMLDITGGIRPGLERSDRRARERLRQLGQETDGLERRHLRGCIGLLDVVESGALIYGVWVAERE